LFSLFIVVVAGLALRSGLQGEASAYSTLLLSHASKARLLILRVSVDVWAGCRAKGRGATFNSRNAMRDLPAERSRPSVQRVAVAGNF
jgi:hypothetical protein